MHDLLYFHFKYDVLLHVYQYRTRKINIYIFIFKKNKANVQCFLFLKAIFFRGEEILYICRNIFMNSTKT